MQQDASSTWKVFLLAWCATECFLFGGFNSAWPSLTVLYKMDGVFSHLCQSESEPPQIKLPLRGNATFEESTGWERGEVSHLDELEVLTCAEQDEAYNYVYTVGIVISPVLSYLLARVNNLRGIRTTRILTIVLLVVGLASMAFTSKELPSPVTVGMIALNVGSSGLYMTSNQVAYKFKASSATAAALLTGTMFAGAGIVPETILVAHNYGVSTRLGFELLGCLLVFVIISTFFFFPKEFFSVEDSGNGNISTELEFQKHRLVEDGRESSLNTSTAFRNLQVANGSSALEASRKSSLLQTMAFPKFYLMLVWRVVHTFLFTFSRGVLNAWLHYVTKQDQSKVNHLTVVYATAGLFSIPIALFGGILFDLVAQCLPDKIPPRGKMYISSAVCLGLGSIIGVAMCACAISEKMGLIYAMMFLMATQQVFLFCFTCAYIRRMYHEEKFAVLLMITALATTPFNFLQIPLFSWCKDDPRNWPRLFWLLLLLMLFTLVHPLYMLRKARTSMLRHQLALKDRDDSKP